MNATTTVTTTTQSTPITSLSPPLTSKPATPLPETTVGPQIRALPTGEDPFWGENLSILFEKSRLVEFYPTSDQTLEERMNAVTRLVLYVSAALSVYQSRATPLHFGIIIVGLIYLMWKNNTITNLTAQTGMTETFSSPNAGKGEILTLPSLEGDDCVMPTPQNPFMNYLLGDDPARPAACAGPGVQETASNLLDRQLFNDVDDLFSKNANQRLFRTMPGTKAVPDRERFANWMIKGDGTDCKTKGQCPPYEDLRMQRQIIPEDLDKNFDVTGFNL
jgi:hypothetical protein